MEQSGAKTDAVVETLDIFPTLCDLTGIDIPTYVQGESLKGILADPNAEGHTAIAYTSKASTIRTSTHRMTLHKDGFVELYDHTAADGETTNIADENPALVEELKQVLNAKMH